MSARKNPGKLALFANRIFDVPMNEKHPEKTALKGIEAFEAFFEKNRHAIFFRRDWCKKEDIELMTDKLLKGRKTEGNYVKLNRMM